MNKETFNKIQATLEGHIAECQFYLKDIETADDLKKLTIEDAQKLQRFCRQEEATQTKVVQCDLYHIIGMGDLTPPQMMKFTYLIRDYLKYRGAIKTIAMNFDKISQLPGLPVTAVYKTHGFSGLTLSKGTELLSTVATTELPYALSGNLILVLKDNLSKFITFWRQKSKSNFSESNFLQKATTGAEYGGVHWAIDNDGNYAGVIKADNVQMLFESCMKAAQETN
jgi:hypothetical protein